jgi:hypothetical protein
MVMEEYQFREGEFQLSLGRGAAHNDPRRQTRCGEPEIARRRNLFDGDLRPVVRRIARRFRRRHAEPFPLQ